MQLPDNHRYIYRSASVSIDSLPARDRTILIALYDFLQALLLELESRHLETVESCKEVSRLIEQLDYEKVIKTLGNLGQGADLSTLPKETAKAYHDIRSGCLTAITLLLDLFKLNLAGPDHLDRLYMLCRDHLKIIRNCVFDLDQEGLERDLQAIPHGVDLLKEKWAGASYSIPSGTAEIDFNTDFTGVVSSCCMEFAALDRTLYNLINNATRFSADGRVRVKVEADDPAGSTNLKFAICNAVTSDDVERLSNALAKHGSRLPDLFEGGLTVDGNGFGLRICADLVCHNYQLGSPAEALKQELLGVSLTSQAFNVWFYCPGEWRSPGSDPARP